jgi:phytoene desaturase
LKKVIVIGSGVAGLASAIRLSAKGYNVKVYEQNAYPGGKLSSFSKDGFRFDAGPSLFTMPENLDELFQLHHLDPREYFNYHQLDIICKYFYEDGTILNAYHDINKFINEIKKINENDSSKIKSFLKESKRIYELTENVFLNKSLHKLKTYLSADTLKAIPFLPTLHLNRSMNVYNENYFSSPHMVQFFNRYATYNGSDPYQAPATLNLIANVEFNKGAYFPEGGMISITNAFYNLAQKVGVEFQFNEQVNEIKYESDVVTGIISNHNFIEADIVVSNMDIYGTYKKLLNKLQAPDKIFSQPRSSSALIFYWGIDTVFPELELHNIFFSNNYKEEFNHITTLKKVYEDPTVYINISSKMNANDAPDGNENWFVMINVPHNNQQDWELIIQEARKNIIAKVSRMLKKNIEPLIISESILDPRTIESKTSSHLGALYGTSSNNKMAAFFRHKNFSSQIKNLYFCGGSVHPGGGIPLALFSGKIVADIIND